VDTVPVLRRGDLTDAQWAVLEPLLPVGKGPGRPAKWSRRQLIDGVRWRVRTGAPWRDMPPCYGCWQTVYGLFRRWHRDGTWATVLTAYRYGPMPRVLWTGRCRWIPRSSGLTSTQPGHAAAATGRGVSDGLCT
jgi:transposase